MSFSITCYKSSAEVIRVDKTDYLTEVITLEGNLRDECSIINPVITIEYEGVPNFNYIYIPTFNRYYFIDRITSITTTLWEIEMKVDVLMSFKEALLNCSGFIDRNENEFNDLIVDNRISLQQGENVEVELIENELFLDNVAGTGTFVMQGLLLTTGKNVTSTSSLSLEESEVAKNE